MSEKRFKVCVDSNNGVGLFDNSAKLIFIKFTNREDAISCENSLKYQCDLMNKLHDENEQLRKRNKFLEEFDGRAETFINLKEENEQLRKELDNFKPVIFSDMQKGTVILYSKGDMDE